ncbi:helix-hairpin-helix protein [Nocardiopsis sp. Huas11]|uniref:ComEA family DNA-binding protein n=1 Tax=Nocardiopsis sp. Huas11 TaxID=2183912 RepID=UPI000F233FA1|nr:helix-hairpin-helix domain-containing protein [Nocardiopsis sp. Huas11]RKS08198.1 helix-hairpin-helix protein [Nocardiopsis sp. Huas11]
MAVVLLFSAALPLVGAVAMLWIWIGGSIRVFDSINEINGVDTAPRSDRRPVAATDPNVIAEQQVRRRRRLRAEARGIAASDAGYARELGIGRPDLRRIFDDGALIDINTAPAHVLSCLPGIDGPTARRIVDHRSAYGRLVPAVEVSAVFGVDPRALPELAEFTVFT